MQSTKTCLNQYYSKLIESSSKIVLVYIKVGSPKILKLNLSQHMK